MCIFHIYIYIYIYIYILNIYLIYISYIQTIRYSIFRKSETALHLLFHILCNSLF